MYGYIIDFKGLPETVWACETNLTDYSWKNRHTKDMLEISVIRAQELTMFYNGTKHHFKGINGISCTVGIDEKQSYCDPETRIEITSVAVRFPEMQIKVLDSAEEIGDFIFLPALFNEIPLEDLSEINMLLHKYIKLNSLDSAENRLQRGAVFFEIISKVSNAAKKKLFGKTEQIKNYYIKKINYIMERDYKGKITEESVAKELGISAVYLSSVYKEVTGITFSKYLLSVRMKKAAELLINSDIPTSKVAFLTGYSDESYFRKRFKNYFGMTVKEYRLIKKGLTLYHDKPQKGM